MKKLTETTKRDGQQTESLEKVREQFEAYRINREKFGPLPADMWEAAVRLCSTYPLSKVSKELRLNYSDLLRRVRAAEGSGNSPAKHPRKCVQGVHQVEFIDLFRTGSHIQPNPQSECIFEIRERDGISLKVHCRGKSNIDILSLCRLFMENR